MKYILQVDDIKKEFRNLSQVEKFGKTYDNATVFGAPMGGKSRKKLSAKNLKTIFKHKDVANISLYTQTSKLSVSMRDGTLTQIEEENRENALFYDKGLG